MNSRGRGWYSSLVIHTLHSFRLLLGTPPSRLTKPPLLVLYFSANFPIRWPPFCGPLDSSRCSCPGFFLVGQWRPYLVHSTAPHTYTLYLITETPLPYYVKATVTKAPNGSFLGGARVSDIFLTIRCESASIRRSTRGAGPWVKTNSWEWGIRLLFIVVIHRCVFI